MFIKTAFGLHFSTQSCELLLTEKNQGKLPLQMNHEHTSKNTLQVAVFIEPPFISHVKYRWSRSNQ